MTIGRPYPKWIIVLLCLLTFLWQIVGSVGAESVAIPPKPANGWYVLDQSKVLSDQQVKGLNSLFEEVRQKTGAQMALAIVPSTGDQTPDEFALETLRSWGVGQKDKDDGLLFLVATDDKKTYIAVGYGLEGILNDAKVGQMLDVYALPAFKQGQMAKGIVDTSKVLAVTIAKAHDVQLTGKATPKANQTGGAVQLETWQVLLLGAGFVGLFILDATLLGGRFTQLLLYMLMLFLNNRGGGGGFGGSGRSGGGGFGGGSGGGGGAGRGW